MCAPTTTTIIRATDDRSRAATGAAAATAPKSRWIAGATTTTMTPNEGARLYTEHRDPFLRRGESEGRFRGEGGSWRRYARRDESFDDQDRWSGPYAGRGPKGYRRSDERIHEDVCERLMEHPSIDASDVEVSVNDGDVTLTGQVESRAIKHLTETMTETVPGVKEVHNHLRVAPQVGGPGSRLVR